jgi:hypothetical protein
MKSKITFLVVLLFPVLFSYGQWQPTNGPYGGTIRDIAIDGNSILAAAYSSGIYISNDNGATWNLSNNGLGNKFVSTLAVNGNTIYAGTDLGIYTSTDHGSTWNLDSAGIGQATVITIDIHGADVFAGTYDGIYHADTGGTGWQFKGLLSTSIFCFEFNGSNIFAGTNFGVFLSTDTGNTWNAVVANGLNNFFVFSMGIRNDSLLVGTAGDGIYVSSDTGNNFVPDTSGFIDLNVFTMLVIGNTVYAGTADGIYYSNGPHTTWSLTSTSLGNIFVHAISQKGSDLFAATANNGVVLSSNGGTSWNESNSGIKNNTIQCLTTDIMNNVYAGTNGSGVYKSTNNGASWINGHGILATLSVNSLLVVDTNIYAGTNDGVYQSTDYGMTWQYPSIDIAGYNVSSLTYDGSVLYAGTYNDGVFASADGGLNWVQVNNGLTDTTINTIVAKGNNIFVGTYGGVFISTNSGTLWTPVNTGLTTPYIYNLIVNSNGDVYAGTDNGIYITTNNGLQWNQANNGLTTLFITSLVAVNGNVIAGSYYGGTRITTDNGGSWTDFNQGWSGNNDIWSLATDGVTIYSGMTSNGVWSRPASDAVEIRSLALNNSDVLIGNNPSSGNFSIRIQGAENKFNLIHVYDQLGKRVYGMPVNTHSNDEITLNLTDLPEGTYFVRLVSKFNLCTKQVIIQR